MKAEKNFCRGSKFKIDEDYSLILDFEEGSFQLYLSINKDWTPER